MAGGKNRTRAAYHNANNQYIAAIEKAERTDEIGRAATNATRSLKDANPNISYNAIRLAMQADKLARATNNQRGKVNEAIGKFNDRVDISKRQLAGERVFSHSVTKEVDNGTPWIQSNQPTVITGQQAEPTPKPTITENIYFEPLVRNFTGFNSSQSTYNDLNSLSSNVQSLADSTGITQNSKQYEAIAEKIKAKLRRDETVKPTGLIASETLTGNPISEVLR